MATTLDPTQPGRGLASAAGGLARRFAPLPPAEPRPDILTRAFGWLRRQEQRGRLSGLDDRLLSDIGISRADAVRESRRWT
jgi:uncharacterized protein YjiS (DUF1127 family)